MTVTVLEKEHTAFHSITVNNSCSGTVKKIPAMLKKKFLAAVKVTLFLMKGFAPFNYDFC